MAFVMIIKVALHKY